MKVLTDSQILDIVAEADKKLLILNSIVEMGNSSESISAIFNWVFHGDTRVENTEEIERSARSILWTQTRLDVTAFDEKTLHYAIDKLHAVQANPITFENAREVLRLANNDLHEFEWKEILKNFLTYVGAEKFKATTTKVEIGRNGSDVLSDLFVVLHKISDVYPSQQIVKKIDDQVRYLNGFQNQSAYFEPIDVELNISNDRKSKSFTLGKDLAAKLNRYLDLA